MAAQLFPRSRRLCDSEDFEVLLRKGRRSSSGPLVARVLPSEKLGALGLSIPKRHLRRAVDRNRVKRLVREAYRKQVQHLESQNILITLGRAPDLELHSGGRKLLLEAINSLLWYLSSLPRQKPGS